MSKLSHRLWAVGLLLALTGCLSPTLPLPPPSRPDVEGPDSSGNVTLTGFVSPSAFVYVDNLRTRESAGQQADDQTGRYQVILGAQVGDHISMFYRLGTELSVSYDFWIESPVQHQNNTTAGAGGTAEGGASN